MADKNPKRIFKSLQLAVSRKYNLSGIRGLLRQAIAGYGGNNVPEISVESNVGVDVPFHADTIIQRDAGIEFLQVAKTILRRDRFPSAFTQLISGHTNTSRDEPRNPAAILSPIKDFVVENLMHGPAESYRDGWIRFVGYRDGVLLIAV